MFTKNCKCYICKKQKTNLLITFDKNNSIIKCHNCGIIYWHPLPKNIPQSDDYKGLKLKTFFKYLKNIRIKQYNKDIKKILLFAKKGGTILDIGCSQGWFLKVASQHGFKTEGVEPSNTLRPLIKKIIPGSKIYSKNFESVQFNSKKYDVVTFWSVLEHTTNPKKQLDKVSKILKKNGILCIRVPNSDGLIPRIIILITKISNNKIIGPAKSLYEYNYHYKHFFHFNLKSLSVLLNEKKFTILDSYTNPSFDINNFNRRTESANSDELGWFKIPGVSFFVKVIYTIAQLLNLNDEIVIIAQKNNVRSIF